MVEATVIFIPKGGKKDITQPNYYRALTLKSFVLKKMEKVVLQLH